MTLALYNEPQMNNLSNVYEITWEPIPSPSRWEIDNVIS